MCPRENKRPDRMKRFGRTALLFVTACIALAGASTAAYGWAPPPIWEAGTCTAQGCTYESIEENPGEAFTHAAAHPQSGITSFELAHSAPAHPQETLKRIRVDVPPGLAADPQTLPTCSRAQFNAGTCSPLTKAGLVELEAFVGAPVGKNLALKLEVLNLEQQPAPPLLFGTNVN